MITLRAMSVGSRSSLQAALEAFEEHGLHPVVDRVFPFDEAAGAFHHLESGSHVGKIAIAMDPGAASARDQTQ